MKNDEMRAQLSAYLDGELGEAERRAVESALAASPELRAELEATRRTAELVRSLPRVSAPADLRPRVEAAIAGEAGASRPWLRTWRLVALAAAACLLIGLLTLLATRPDQPRTAARTVDALKSEARPAEPPAPTTAADKTPALPANELRGVRREKAEDNSELAMDAPRERPAKTGVKHAAASEKKIGVVAEGESRGGADVRQDLKPTEAKAAKPAAGWAVGKAGGAPARDADSVTEEAEKGDSAFYAAVQGGEARKLAGQTELLDRAFGANRRAADRAELLADIEQERQAAAPTFAPAVMPPAAPAATPAPEAGAARPVPGPTREVRLAYTDLAQCLADVRAALEEANLAYAVQPIGGGQFVVETTLPEPEAHALIARFAGNVEKQKEQAKREFGYTQEAPRAQAAKSAPARPVRLVLRFVRADAQDAGRASKAAERAAPPAEPK